MQEAADRYRKAISLHESAVGLNPSDVLTRRSQTSGSTVSTCKSPAAADCKAYGRVRALEQLET